MKPGKYIILFAILVLALAGWVTAAVAASPAPDTDPRPAAAASESLGGSFAVLHPPAGGERCVISDVYAPASVAPQPFGGWASVPLLQPYDWIKVINGVVWAPGMVVTVQTSDTIMIEELVTSAMDYRLVENWDPAHLRLLGWEVSGGNVITGTGYLEWFVPPGFPPQRLIKWFHVEPCTWTDTVLDETLFVDGLPPDIRPVPIHKLPPELWIDAEGGGPAWAGATANFHLDFGNSGGYENNVVIRNTFPPEAPFVSSVPPPTLVDPSRLWAEWRLAGLAQGAVDQIHVTVAIQPSVPVSTTIVIWDGIYDHTGALADDVTIRFHVEPWITWDKTIDGVAWQPGMQITRQTSDTIVVQEVLHLTPPVSTQKAAVTPVLVPSSAPPEHAAGVTAQVSGASATAAPSSPEAVLWDQPSTANVAGISSYMTDLGRGAYSADDFENAAPWAIDTIFVDGWDTGGDVTRASLLTWTIYPDAGGVPAGYPGDGSGTELWSLSLPPGDPAVTIGLGTYDDVTLDVIQATGGPLDLPPGHYWLVFYPSLDRAPGMWFWRFADTSNLNHPQMVDPTDYFGYGWLTWTDWASHDPTFTDMTFRLEGSVVPPPAYAQIESWDPRRLRLLDWAATGGNVMVQPGQVVWTGEIVAPETITLTKWFHVEPCTWTQTVLWEELWLDQAELDQRPVVIDKLPPALWIDAAYQPGVLSGVPAAFTLIYSNTGGYENKATIRNQFPPEALFLASTPAPDRQDPNGLWAEWDIAGLPQGVRGEIDVRVAIAAGLPVSTTIEIWDGIYNHTYNPTSPGAPVDEVTIGLHVEPAFEWIKLIDGVPWGPNLVVTVQTSDTIVIEETVASPLDYTLVENWNPEHLKLVDWSASGGQVIVPPEGGMLEWHVPPGLPPQHLTKWFHVEPCTWTDTLLHELLVVGNGDQEARPVPIHKLPSELWIDAAYDPEVLSGLPAAFTLIYSNTGGYENRAMIRNVFAPEALFLASTPAPNRQDPNGLWAEWDIAGLPQGFRGTIDVTVAIAPSLRPSTTIEIWDGIYDHTYDPTGTGVPVDEVTIGLHVKVPITWDKTIDGAAWQPGMEITRQTSDTITVQEVLHIAAAGVPFAQIENWDPSRLRLLDWTATGGTVIVEPGHAVWSGQLAAAATITLTKWFHVEPCTWTQTELWEELWSGQIELEQRPVVIHKLPPQLWISAVYAPEVRAAGLAGFTLNYGNLGGYENAASIRNDFPPTAPFVSSVPPPASVDPNGLWAEWFVGDLPMGATGSIDVKVYIQREVPIGTWIAIVDVLRDHTLAAASRVQIDLHVIGRWRWVYLPLVERRFSW